MILLTFTGAYAIIMSALENGADKRPNRENKK